MTNPKTESVDWFNAVLSRLWASGLRNILNDVGQKQANAHIRTRAEKSNWRLIRHLLDNVRLERMDWGPCVPQVTGVTAFKKSLLQDPEWKDVAPFGDSITLDIGLKIDLETDICVSLPHGFQFIVKNVKLVGVTGFRMDLLTDMERLGNVKFYFVRTPSFDYEFGGCLSWLNNPDVKHVVKIVLTWMLNLVTLPSYIKIPMATLEDMKVQSHFLEEPKGLMRLEIVEGRKLEGAEHTETWGSHMIYGFWGYINPYVMCIINGEHATTTKVVKKSCDPVWNAHMHIPITMEHFKDEEIRFHLMDKTVAKPCLLGSSTIGVRKAVNLCVKRHQPVDEWVSVDKDKGEVRVKITFAPVIEAPLSRDSRRALFSVMVHEVNMEVEVENPKLVFEISGRTARAITAKGHAGRVLKVGQEFTFYVSDFKTDRLTISLVNMLDSSFSIVKMCSYMKKGLDILLTEGRVPTKAAAVAQEHESKNNILLAQATEGISFFTGKKQVVSLIPVADGHRFEMTLITKLFYLDDGGDDTNQDFSDSETEDDSPDAATKESNATTTNSGDGRGIKKIYIRDVASQTDRK